MLPSILVPLDGSPLADEVLPHVIHLARAQRAHVDLLRVLGPAEDEAPARAQLDVARARVAAAGVEAEAHLARGEPAEEIARQAAARGAGLVALASHGRGGALRALRGSVAEAVARRGPVPALIVTRRVGAPAFFRRLLVALDGTDRSALAVPVVLALAQGSPETEVLLLRVGIDGEPPGRLADDLRPALDALRAGGVRARLVVAYGEPSAEVLAAAEREAADLVVVASRGRQGLERALAGSHAEAVLRRCRHPVLVVHAPG